MKTTFNINLDADVEPGSKLVVEISNRCISFVVFDANSTCTLLHSSQFAAAANAEDVVALLKELFASNASLNQHFESTHVIYCLPNAILVPNEFTYNNNHRDMIELMYGDTGLDEVKTESVALVEAKLYYVVPKEIDSLVAYLFSAPTATHLYSHLPTLIESTDEGSNIYCVFGSSCFTAMLVKNGKVLGIQQYAFSVPEDVSFHLLTLCTSFDVLPKETTIHLNGMISDSSNLFNELRKYFLYVKFAGLSNKFNYHQDFGKYPAHYFSHLISAASCVL